jgi:hypothetical protein
VRTILQMCESGCKSLNNTDRVHVAFEPSLAHADWHSVKEETAARKLFGRVPAVHGAITADGLAWIYWEHRVPEDSLKGQRFVLRRAIDDVEARAKAILSLIETAAAEAMV